MNTQRPLFLTILCILSFAGIGINLIYYIYSYFSFSQQQVSGLDFLGAFNPMIKTMLSFVKFIKWSIILNIIFNLVCLLGVFLMFRLNKKGYFAYIVGELAPVVMMFIGYFKFQSVIRMMPSEASTLLSLPFFVLMASIAILFVVLYGLNLKHMK